MYFKANNDDEWYNIEHKSSVDDSATEAVWATGDGGDDLVYQIDGNDWSSVDPTTPVYETYGACCVSEDSSVTNVLHEACCVADTIAEADRDCTDVTELMSDTTAGEKHFRVLFQMGDEDSEWRGVKKTIT